MSNLDTLIERHLLPRGAKSGKTQPFYLRLLANRPFQLLFGYLICVLVPSIAWKGLIVFQSWPQEWAWVTLVGCGASYAAGIMILWRLSRYPGAQGNAHIPFVFLGTFGLLVAVILFGQLGFSRYQLLVSFGLSIGWGFIGRFAEARVHRMLLAIVPAGEVSELEDIDYVDWAFLETPNSEVYGVDGIVADLHADLSDDWQAFLARCALERIPVYHTKQVHESLTGRVQIRHLSENNIGSLLTSLEYEKLKRAFDLIFLVIILPVLLPLMLAVALAVRIDSSGPILFKQRRVGFKGKEFWIYKFRTMRHGKDGPDFTREGDDRITRLGRFIRRHRIDELPQIINIFKGEMSWIGPRPESRELCDWYQKDIPFFTYRHVVRPGISGWAQVKQGFSAGVSDVTEKLHYDFYYIKHFSPWLDLLIFFQTIRTLLNGFGAR